MSNLNVAEVLKRLDHASEVVRALGRGEKLQYKSPQAETWRDSSVEKPALVVLAIINSDLAYRVKPEPLVRYVVKAPYGAPVTGLLSESQAIKTAKSCNDWNNGIYTVVKMVEEIES